jgi:hypothetical protein
LLDQLKRNISLNLAHQLLEGDRPINESLINEMGQLVNQGITLTLILFIINNIVFYTLYYLDKKAGVKYVKYLAITGFVLTFFNLFAPGTDSIIWFMLILGQVLWYLQISLSFLKHHQVKA